ncbi:MAG TPA: GNAT family N-acetyltransferase [Gemmatimonadaceae bacterium]
MPRRAATDDVAAIVRLVNTAYRVEDFFVRGDRTSEEDVRARVAAPHGSFLVIDAPEAHALAGAVYVEIRGDRGHFAMLAVDPERQGQGIARALVRAVEDHCLAAGCHYLDIDVVNLRSELPPFYAKLGFVPDGTAPFPDPTKLRRAAHVVLMTKPLVVQSG